jgi:hypothetical protein
VTAYLLIMLALVMVPRPDIPETLFDEANTSTNEIVAEKAASWEHPNILTAAGLPPLPLIHGQIVFTVDDQGNVTSIQRVTVTVKDVCQLLQ